MEMEKIESVEFERIGKNLEASQKISRPSMSYLQDATRRLKKNKPAMISLCVLVFLIFMSIIGPMISKALYGHDYRKQLLMVQNQPPIVSNARSVKVTANKAFQYKKYSHDTRKADLKFTGVEMSKKGGTVSFIIGDKADESLQGDKKEFKLEIKTKTGENLDSMVEKLNAEGERILKEDPAFRGIHFSHSGNTLYVKTQGEKRFNSEYWFGTDQFGRDMFTRLWEGGRVSFLIAAVAVFVTMIFGVTYGGIAGYLGGKVDTLMMRFVEVLMVVPDMLYTILLLTVMRPGLVPIIIVLAVTEWMGIARIVRGEVLRLKHSEYVLAAQTLGASPRRIIFKHLIPNTMGPIIVQMTMMIPAMIFVEAFLSFFGLGVPAPFASWGSLISNGSRIFYEYPHILLIPAAALSLTMLAFNILGDGLRDALDPKLRK